MCGAGIVAHGVIAVAHQDPRHAVEQHFAGPVGELPGERAFEAGESPGPLPRLFAERDDQGRELPGGTQGCEFLQYRTVGPAERADLDVDLPAAGEPGRERILVGDAVGLDDRPRSGQHLERQLVHRTLHAAAGEAAGHFPALGDSHRRPIRPRRGAARAHHHGQGTGGALAIPGDDLVEDVPHDLLPPRSRGVSGAGNGPGVDSIAVPDISCLRNLTFECLNISCGADRPEQEDQVMP